MKSFYSILFVILFLFFNVQAQERALEVGKVVTTQHSTTIKDVKLTFNATTGTQPVWNEEGKVIAALHYTYYERTDIPRKATRPLVISFNGGPGSGSVWMHLAYTGPSILKIDDEGFPIQPYGVKTNPYSILDVADVVYVNPVNGFKCHLSLRILKSILVKTPIAEAIFLIGREKIIGRPFL